MEKKNSQRRDRHKNRKSVPYGDAVRFGLIAGIVTFLVSAVATEGSKLSEEGFAVVLRMGMPALYGGIAFVVATLVAFILNWVVSRKELDSEIDGPVLH
ncbi:hypothetical protein [Brevibacterium yomogidense]|uniref:hypothetical protein n=1 Tax=Brevibacterium yomogidense TaxID=946573 RepID=UPI0018E03BA1|nr:hypothetical protein [Brevibacterium yomogidense]